MKRKKKKSSSHKVLYGMALFTVLAAAVLAGYVVMNRGSMSAGKSSAAEAGHKLPDRDEKPDSGEGKEDSQGEPGVTDVVDKGKDTENEQEIAVPGDDGLTEDKRLLNVIFEYEKKSGAIPHIVLEVWNREAGKLHYLTIPADTSFTMSKKLYQKLSAYNAEVPQIVRLNNLYHYFEKDTAFQYGRQMIGDMLGVKVDYYTVMSGKLFAECFKVDEEGAVRFSAGQETAMAKLKTADDMENYITDLFPRVKTDYTLADRIENAADYLVLAEEGIEFIQLPGVKENAGFVLDKDALAEMTATLLRE